ncbi:uncharacterized protein LOC107485090 [Arachis duranensis]|uniref:Uncharacterized protein LOC107485090 n=1 Tax=Arachis duranensis TaxID=130453 RepID=A0A9C6TM71_ARADU|nr:uncharacterized protein LOC107485090 [Arachis duranensis]
MAMFNEALYGKRRRQDNTLIDHWIDECLFKDSEEEDITEISNEKTCVPSDSRRSLKCLSVFPTKGLMQLKNEACHHSKNAPLRYGLFEDEYLQKPNPNDVQRLLQTAEGHGFPGMLGSSDYMHWQWKNCPKTWKDHSPVFDDILNDCAPEVNYTINGNNYTMEYYLADGIYPEWATFVKSISKPQGEKCKLFAQYQEEQRKDVERAFRVLQAHFAIIRGPARFWEKKKLANIMRACIILHNMIVEDKRDTYAGNFAQGLEYDDVENGLSQPQLGEEDFALYHQFLQRNAQLRNR